MDYESMTDAEMNREVAKRLRDVRDYCRDPGAWGWLMETEKMALEWWSTPPRWIAQHDSYGMVEAETPGRAIAIAYLGATEDPQ